MYVDMVYTLIWDIFLSLNSPIANIESDKINKIDPRYTEKNRVHIRP